MSAPGTRVDSAGALAACDPSRDAARAGRGALIAAKADPRWASELGLREPATHVAAPEATSTAAATSTERQRAAGLGATPSSLWALARVGSECDAVVSAAITTEVGAACSCAAVNG